MRFVRKSEMENKINPEDYLPFLNSAAWNMSQKLPHNKEELIGPGWEGLVQAAESFDPRIGVCFTAFAVNRVRGEMIDYSRHCDHLSRRSRFELSEIYKAERLLTQDLQRKPSDKEVAAESGLQESVVSNRKLTYGLYELDKAVCESDTGFLDGKDLLKAKPVIDRTIDDTIKFLSPRSKMMMKMRFVQDLTFKEIGEQCDLSESRVCQIFAGIIETMHRRLAV